MVNVNPVQALIARNVTIVLAFNSSLQQNNLQSKLTIKLYQLYAILAVINAQRTTLNPASPAWKDILKLLTLSVCLVAQIVEHARVMPLIHAFLAIVQPT